MFDVDQKIESTDIRQLIRLLTNGFAFTIPFFRFVVIERLETFNLYDKYDYRISVYFGYREVTVSELKIRAEYLKDSTIQVFIDIVMREIIHRIINHEVGKFEDRIYN